MARRHRAGLLPAAIALAVSGCDLSSKHWAVRLTASGPRTIIPGALDLVHWENPGMAFSLLRDWPPAVRLGLLVASAALGITGALIFAARRRTSRFVQVGLGLIAGGAAGNLVDRLAGGTVTDFLYLHRGTLWWPAFNVADIAICIGAGLLLVGADRKTQASAPRPRT